MNTLSPEFRHLFIPGQRRPGLLLLHGTGGDENSLIPLGRCLRPGAPLLSPRGRVLENDMPRFFRRLAEGIFDEPDLIRRTHELADFLTGASGKYGVDQWFAIGYSNGANIAGSLLLLRPEVIAGAALLRPMVPLVPEKLPALNGKPVLIAAGSRDPICAPEESRAVAALLKRAGAKVRLEFEDAEHGLTETTVATTQRWLEEANPEK